MARIVVPYFTNYKRFRHTTGPFFARFSNIWLALGARNGKKFAWVDHAHKR
ncbi:uncharacterized protein MYCFIDRAFT_33022 [Pseudocercospora fijiensis CIRAD86]|uniref:Uncharacterized protein n=1 Tax=Pseudocercospora fijiensis (strain CIRAD86) TaxID=383855 RepID=M2YVJ2_PSEFD|nr:uncharacterized protein MYCFIDRAFT_33022 [Pseudocercospora fijiensis CIRAD86]EME81720.1 hypothetical protein MYCFIDRAFT_33022 [Pseudocercospora fijiensis CIRAD86]